MATASQLASPKRRRTQIPLRRKVLYSAVMLLSSLLLAEGTAQVMLWRCYGRLQEWERLHEYHPELGWSNLKNHRVPHRYGENNHATHNSQGFRGKADYSRDIPSDRYRIISLGDSFTYGVDVDDRDTFPAQLEVACPAIQSVNMGVAGYGIDQVYLWYMSEGVRLDTDLLLFAFIEDDFSRMKMNAFLTKNPKPQLVLQGDTLKPVNIPVPTWGDAGSTGWLEEFPNRTALVQILRKVYNTYIERYDVFPVAERVFEVMNDCSQQRNQKFVLVYLPSKKDFANDQETDVAREVQRIAERKQIAFLNLMGAFKSLPPEELARLFVPDGRHYSKHGNRFVAEKLLENIRQDFPGVPK